MFALEDRRDGGGATSGTARDSECLLNKLGETNCTFITDLDCSRSFASLYSMAVFIQCPWCTFDFRASSFAMINAA